MISIARFASAFLLAGGVALSAENNASWVIANAGLLNQLQPMSLKQAAPVPEIRNPLRTAAPIAIADAVRATPKDKTTDTAKIRSTVSSRLKSVVHGPTPIIAIDTRSYRVGDEILIGEAARLEPVLSGARVFLNKVAGNELILTVQSLSSEGQTPWQIDVTVPLPPFLRRH